MIAAGYTIRDKGGSLFGVDYIGLGDTDGKMVRLPACFGLSRKYSGDVCCDLRKLRGRTSNGALASASVT
jgi:hypothetical protein